MESKEVTNHLQKKQKKNTDILTFILFQIHAVIRSFVIDVSNSITKAP